MNTTLRPEFTKSWPTGSGLGFQFKSEQMGNTRHVCNISSSLAWSNGLRELPYLRVQSKVGYFGSNKLSLKETFDVAMRFVVRLHFWEIENTCANTV